MPYGFNGDKSRYSIDELLGEVTLQKVALESAIESLGELQQQYDALKETVDALPSTMQRIIKGTKVITIDSSGVGVLFTSSEWQDLTGHAPDTTKDVIHVCNGDDQLSNFTMVSAAVRVSSAHTDIIVFPLRLTGNTSVAKVRSQQVRLNYTIYLDA